MPLEVTRIYRGVWGKSTLAAPLVGVQAAHEDEVWGLNPAAAYLPVRFRGEVGIKQRRLFRSEQWNVHMERAMFDSIPPLQGRHPKDELWCLLLMHELTPTTREHFWVNPLDPRWYGHTESTVGRTFYAGFAPLPVSVACVRFNLLRGATKSRRPVAMKHLKQAMKSVLTKDEWVPPDREAAVEQPKPKKKKLPSHLLQAARGT